MKGYNPLEKGVNKNYSLPQKVLKWYVKKVHKIEIERLYNMGMDDKAIFCWAFGLFDTRLKNNLESKLE